MPSANDAEEEVPSRDCSSPVIVFACVLVSSLVVSATVIEKSKRTLPPVTSRATSVSATPTLLANWDLTAALRVSSYDSTSPAAEKDARNTIDVWTSVLSGMGGDGAGGGDGPQRLQLRHAQ